MKLLLILLGAFLAQDTVRGVRLESVAFRFPPVTSALPAPQSIQLSVLRGASDARRWRLQAHALASPPLLSQLLIDADVEIKI